ncbi:MAG TPA: ribosome silencing factor [Candidatus Limiplasma sp.]|nr:ribosome silencing factor [Candidatus Limiplasma sp.]HRX07787.1 ribosome silencing factor [Candidatus Limiplasma sp.]
MTSKEIAIKAAEILHNKGAQNITVLDVSKMTVVTEAMVIASGRNALQARALADDLEEQLEKLGLSPLRRDGHSGSRWVVLDYGAVFIHIFLPQEREFYHLDKLWEQEDNRLPLPFTQET